MLTDQISKWVHYFQQQGYQKGDRIVVFSQNRIELFAILFRVWFKRSYYMYRLIFD